MWVVDTIGTHWIYRTPLSILREVQITFDILFVLLKYKHIVILNLSKCFVLASGEV